MQSTTSRHSQPCRMEDTVADMRCCKFRVRSTLAAANQRKGERRFAHVWVNEKELDKAEDVARALLAGQVGLLRALSCQWHLLARKSLPWTRFKRPRTNGR